MEEVEGHEGRWSECGRWRVGNGGAGQPEIAKMLGRAEFPQWANTDPGKQERGDLLDIAAILKAPVSESSNIHSY